MKSEQEVRDLLKEKRAWMDENEGGGSSEEPVEWGWTEALAWVLGEKP